MSPPAEGVVPEQIDDLLFRVTALSAALQKPFEEICGRLDVNIESDRTDAEVEYNQVVDQLEMAFGASATHVDANSDQYFANREIQDSYRLFAEAAYDFREFTFHFGAMAQDASNVDDTQYAGRIAVNWQYKYNQSIRLATAEGFRIPSLVESDASWSVEVELDGVDLPGFDGLVNIAGRDGNSSPEVQPERIRSYEVGYFITGVSFGCQNIIKYMKMFLRGFIVNRFYHTFFNKIRQGCFRFNSQCIRRNVWNAK